MKKETLVQPMLMALRSVCFTVQHITNFSLDCLSHIEQKRDRTVVVN